RKIFAVQMSWRRALIGTKRPNLFSIRFSNSSRCLMTSHSVRSSAVSVSLVLFTTAVLTASAGAAVILNLVISPATTRGGGATSTRSGANAFQIYAIDTAGFGISGYNLTMGPVVTASNNRTPL